jgi:hypothetical protein
MSRRGRGCVGVALRDFQNFGIWNIYKFQIQLFIVATYIFFQDGGHFTFGPFINISRPLCIVE